MPGLLPSRDANRLARRLRWVVLNAGRCRRRRLIEMFDLIARPTVRPLQERSLGSRIAAILAHAIALMAVLALPIFHTVGARPEVPTTLTYVATPVTLSAPVLPATPAAPPPPTPSEVKTPKHVDAIAEHRAPAEAPSDSQAEPVSSRGVEAAAGVEERSAGESAEAGAGGIAGGIGAGLSGAVATPLPPPPAAAASTPPVRVGGAIKVPSLINRVEPVYSAVAAAAEMSGLVILEAIVDVNGSVESVKVLRSRGALLDNAAIAALKQWKYSPLVVNGAPTPFAVTITFNFKIG